MPIHAHVPADKREKMLEEQRSHLAYLTAVVSYLEQELRLQKRTKETQEDILFNLVQGHFQLLDQEAEQTTELKGA